MLGSRDHPPGGLYMTVLQQEGTMTKNQRRRAGAPDHIPIFEGIILNLGDAGAPWDEKSIFCQKNDQIGQDNHTSVYYRITAVTSAYKI